MKRKLRSHKFNVIGVIIGLSIFLLAVGQLDLLTAPYVWADIHYREVFSLNPSLKWMMWSGDLYNLMLWMTGVGLLIFGMSLWFWENGEAKKK